MVIARGAFNSVLASRNSMVDNSVNLLPSTSANRDAPIFRPVRNS